MAPDRNGCTAAIILRGQGSEWRCPPTAQARHRSVLFKMWNTDDCAVVADVFNNVIGLLAGVAKGSKGACTVWFTITIDPPPTSVLNLVSAKSGSMQVVSQSIIKPMVPVGASSVAWLLRTPYFGPARRLRPKRLAAACNSSSLTRAALIVFTASRCLF